MSNKKLILGTVNSDFSFKYCVPIATSCFLGNEDILGWEEFSFSPDPYQNQEELKSAEIKIDKIIGELSPLVFNYLNSHHKSKKSDGFWKILVYPWLYSLVQNVIERNDRVTKFLEIYSESNIEVNLVELENDLDIHYTLDFNQKVILQNDFNEWIYSEVLKNRIPTRWKKSHISKKIVLESSEYRDEDKGENGIKGCLLGFFENFNRVKGVYGGSALFSLISTIILLFKRPPKRVIDFEKNQSSSINIEEIGQSIDWEKLVFKTLPKFLLNKDLLKRRYKFINKGYLIVTGTQLYVTDIEKIKIANFYENGGYILATQHGCGYGVYTVITMINNVEYSRDGFITWGWKKQNGYEGNFIPLPSPYMSKISMKALRGKRNGKIILIGTRYNGHQNYFASLPQPCQIIELRKEKLQFLKLLDEDFLKKFMYRGYPSHKTDFKDRDYILSHLPNIKSCDGDLNSQLLQAEISIIDHPGTTFFMCLAANIPVIGVWKAKHWGYCEQSRPYFESLAAKEMLFETFEEALTKIKQIENNIDLWWKDEDFYNVRKKWVHQYARTSKYWWLDWMKFYLALKPREEGLNENYNM